MNITEYNIYCKLYADSKYEQEFIDEMLRRTPVFYVAWEYDGDMAFRSKTRISNKFVKEELGKRIRALATRLRTPITFLVFENCGGGIAKGSLRDPTEPE